MLHYQTPLIVKGFLLWLAILPLAIANGAFRERALIGRIGTSRARFVSGLTLIALILVYALLTVPWLAIESTAVALLVGVEWTVLTLAFEFLFGRFVAKKGWDELLAAYRFEGGEIWPIVVIVVLCAPLVGWWLSA